MKRGTVLLLTVLLPALRAAEPPLIDPLKLNEKTRPALEANKRRQIETIKKSPAFHSFSFKDERARSGITFHHHAVDDAAKDWKPAHYDHGSGVAVADVDGDGKLDLYFVNQLGGNELWRNLGGGKFENITPTAGVALTDKICVAAAFADIDNDGRPDLFVTTVRGGNVLFRNAGNGRFEDITSSAGVGYVGHSSGIVFFDFNRDGLLDLFVVNVGKYTFDTKGRGDYYRAYPGAFVGHLEPARSEQSILYQNFGGGRFKDISKEMNLQHTAWSGEATACDVNEDGFPDLYVVTMQGDDKYYENQAGKGFVEKTAEYFPKTPWGAMGIKFFDFNNDGRADLYITDMHSDMTQAQTGVGTKDYSPRFEKEKSDAWCTVEWNDQILQGASNNIFGNAFYQNLGNQHFAEVSQKIGAETYWPWGPSVGDLNADGFEDIFVTAGMGYPFRYGANSVLLNERGQHFVDAEFALGVEPRQAGIEIPYFTIDCSGEDKDKGMCYHKKGLYRVLASTSSRSSVIVDIDDDGDLDLITNDMNDRPQILISNLAQTKKINFLKVHLVGTASNRDALGAVIRVKCGGQAYTRLNDGKSGYLAQSQMPLYFGLGDNSRIDSIEVTWPSGKSQTANQSLNLNGPITITEGR
jgi:enediyne biosynthesis protein E4